MKYIIIIMLLSVGIYAQNDYPTTAGLYGTELENELHQLIKGHIRFQYSSSSTDVWNILTQADQHPNNSNDIITIYTQEAYNGPLEYNNGNGWNREHVWAKSHGFPSSGDTAYTDCHHLKAADISTNSARGNKDFDNGGTIYVDNSSGETDCRTSNYTWEVGDSRKGDVARIMFYMATRYNSTALDLNLVESVNTSGPNFGRLSTLVQWNGVEAPDYFETRRNNVVETYQHNRNPFIDHPEFVNRIYKPTDLIIDYAQAIAPYKFVIKFSKEINASSVDNSDFEILYAESNITNATVGYNGDNSFIKITLNENFPDEKYYVRVNGIQATSGEDIVENSISTVYIDPTVDLENGTELPLVFKLNQNYPNPFNPTTNISFSIKEAGYVSLKVFNSIGQQISTLISSEMQFGLHSVVFDAKNLSTGIYFYRLESGTFTETKKMILIK